jgi:thiol:disulfide interchange protein DsbD
MWNLEGPLIVVAACFGLGVLASFHPSIYLAIPRTSALLGSATARPTSYAAFLFAVALLISPLGIIAAVAGEVAFYTVWSTPTTLATACFVVLCLTFAASMFGAFELTLPASVRTKLAAVGGGDLPGAFALGLAVVFLGTGGLLPFALTLCVIVSRARVAWIGGLSLFAFALGAFASTILAGVFPGRLPKPGPWLTAPAWGSGVLFGFLGFTLWRETDWRLRDFVREPHYAFGLVTGGILLAGVVLGALHVMTSRRGCRLAPLSRPTKLASMLPAIVGVSLFVSWVPHPHGNAPPIKLITDETRGRAKAEAEHKPVVIAFTPTWCCAEVHRDMFPDPRVREEAKRFVAIAIDASDDEEQEVRRLQNKYGIVGLPTILVFDRDGREVSRLNNVVSPEELVAEMKKAR